MAGYVSTYALVAAFLNGFGYDKIYRRPQPNNAYIVPYLVIARIGGSDRVVTIDKARVAIDVYASTEDSAEEIGEDARAAMRTKMRGFIYGGAAVGLVETMSAPQLLPWSASNAFKVGAAYQLTVHQYVGIS